MELANCVLTGIPLTEEGTMTTRDNIWVRWYAFTANNDRVVICLSEGLFNSLEYESPISKIIEDNRTLLIGELAKENFQKYKHKVFHWDDQIEGLQDHLNLKALLADLIDKNDYPKTRKEKYDNLLKFLHNSQTFEGQELRLKFSAALYGQLYFNSFDEMRFFLRELQRKELIEYREASQSVQFTFYGLEYIDTLKKSSDFDINIFSKPKYQIGLSFAGEDRPYVDQVASHLKELGVSVFYDNYELVDLWGKDLYQHLNDVYKTKCEYCIVFVSEHYAKKLWTIHELKSAQTKAFNENKEYILPVRFDNTELPGVNNTVGYMDCNKITPLELAKLAARKVEKINFLGA